MDTAIDRVMQTYGMIASLTPEQEAALRDKVTLFLTGLTETDENKLAIEGLRFVRETANSLGVARHSA